jgi:ribosomal protein S18 acetylase RimI-like enzyme
MLRPAQESDFPSLRRLSGQTQPSDEVLHAQIQRGCLRIIETNSALIGFLKFSILWETLPFIEVIWLTESFRGQGLGSQAVREWEQEMGARGFDLVLSSTGSDETAQHFWRKLGYVDCGSLSVRSKPAELFLQKRLLGAC